MRVLLFEDDTITDIGTVPFLHEEDEREETLFLYESEWADGSMSGSSGVQYRSELVTLYPWMDAVLPKEDAVFSIVMVCDLWRVSVTQISNPPQ